MKKIILSLLCIALSLSLCSCSLFSWLGSDEDESSSYVPIGLGSQSESVSQAQSSYASESMTESETVAEAETSNNSEQTHSHTFTSVVTEPVCVSRGYTTHTCECGYYFVDTFVEGTIEHSFENGICTVCDEVDYPELINIVSTYAIKANMTVKTKYHNRSFGMQVDVGHTTGSGVIIDYVDGDYYLLTNNHVVYSKQLDDISSYSSYYVYDYLGNEYQATLVAAKAKYDLAIVKFSSEQSYTVLPLEHVNSQKGDLVISLGQPEGQSNTITLGNVQGYGGVSLEGSHSSESNVTFEVLKHDAYINSGSSGGALLDARLNVIGINYAGALDDDGTYLASFTIPVEKVYDFFSEVGFNYAPEAEEDVA